MSPVFVRRVELPVHARIATAWHERPDTFERLSPPWQKVRKRGTSPGIVLGARYSHTHAFEPLGERCILEDRIDYQRPFPPLARLGGGPSEKSLDALFAWRHRVTRLDLERLAARDGRAFTVGVTGASGMIGRELITYLGTQGVNVKRFVRRAARGPGEIAWDPARSILDPAAMVDVDAIVHLAGAGIADAPWTPARRRELVESRVRSTGLLASRLARMPVGPRVLVSASAVGWYGDRGEAALDESSTAGTGFLAELGQAWERAAQPAAEAGVRIVHPRIGLVLWPRGGALTPLLMASRFGAGGPLGHGRQWWSWITLHDLIDLLVRAVDDASLSGSFNAVAPEPVRQHDFARALGRVLHRPSFVPAPAFALHALLGRDMADQMLLGSQRLTPGVLLERAHPYRDPQLEPALAALLGRAKGMAA
ncbi:MAG: TIGR01777 family oxidoreductase [Candidatus Eisenbacteria bacterium]